MEVLVYFFSETAINIGYSCMLLTENMVDVFIINGKDKETVQNQILACQTKIDAASPKNSVSHDEDIEMKGVKRNSHVRFAENSVSRSWLSLSLIHLHPSWATSSVGRETT